MKRQKQRLKEEITALDEEKDITPMNEKGGKEEIVTGVASDGVRGAEVNDDGGDGVGLGDQDVKKDDNHGVGVGMMESRLRVVELGLEWMTKMGRRMGLVMIMELGLGWMTKISLILEQGKR
jgi:hypothetical protein